MDIPVSKITGKQAKEMLEIIVEKLDALDCDDYFGSEGWKHFFGLED